jgi:DNA topoisomerase-1
MLQLGNPDKDDKENKPQFAPMPRGAKVETVTLEQALQAFKLPREVGTTEDGKSSKPTSAALALHPGRKTFVSIKPLDPHDITEAASPRTIR